MLVWYGFMIKKYDFDRVVLFVSLIWLNSIDFTGVLNDLWDANRWFLMCYFIIIYGIFGRVRENACFIRAWGYFWWILVIFCVVKNGGMLDFKLVCRSGYRSDFELRKSIFRSKYGCGTDSLVFAAGYLFLNVNYPPCFDPKKIL